MPTDWDPWPGKTKAVRLMRSRDDDALDTHRICVEAEATRHSTCNIASTPGPSYAQGAMIDER